MGDKGGVKSFKPSPSNSKAVGAIMLGDGTEIHADVVVLGVGVRPATDFLRNIKLSEALREDGGLIVDGRLRVKGFKYVFAIGVLHFSDADSRGDQSWEGMLPSTDLSLNHLESIQPYFTSCRILSQSTSSQNRSTLWTHDRKSRMYYCYSDDPIYETCTDTTLNHAISRQSRPHDTEGLPKIPAHSGPSLSEPWISVSMPSFLDVKIKILHHLHDLLDVVIV